MLAKSRGRRSSQKKSGYFFHAIREGIVSIIFHNGKTHNPIQVQVHDITAKYKTLPNASVKAKISNDRELAQV
jgi:hypothetical protein